MTWIYIFLSVLLILNTYGNVHPLMCVHPEGDGPRGKDSSTIVAER